MPDRFPTLDLFDASGTERREIIIEFDGGTSCNIPRLGFGVGYGSYQIADQPIIRVEFGEGHSCNSAEIRTLTAALLDLAGQFDPATIDVLIRGDSQVALKWANPGYRKHPKMTSTENFRTAIEDLRKINCRFRSIKTQWRTREVSVQLFGH